MTLPLELPPDRLRIRYRDAGKRPLRILRAMYSFDRRFIDHVRMRDFDTAARLAHEFGRDAQSISKIHAGFLQQYALGLEADASERAGQLERARMAYQSRLRHRACRRALRGFLYWRLGEIERQLGRGTVARRLFRRGLQFAADDKQIANLLEQALAE